MTELPTPLAMSRFSALLLLFLASMASPAFSADALSGTTRPPGREAEPAEEIDPATGLSRATIVRPLREAPPVPETRRPVVPQSVRPHIALILPIASQALGRLAEAVRLGFSAAAEASGKDSIPVAITATDNEAAALVEACRVSLGAGALLVVGGLTRDGANALARSDCARQPTLALNELPAMDNPPASLYSFSLSLEHEARQVALLAVSEGGHSVIVITSTSPLARRVQDAFEREWTRDAGEIRARITFSGSTDDAPLVRDKIATLQADMVFMALDQPEARAVRPYVTGMLPLYATSMSVNPRAEAIVNVDLQGVRYEEMPWFVQPDHAAVMIYPPPRTPMSVEQERLYAFGVDVYRLAQQVARGNARTPLDGVTGKIALEAANGFQRTLTPAEVDGGRVIPLRAP